MGIKKINKILGYALVTSMLVGTESDEKYPNTNIRGIKNIKVFPSEELMDGVYEVINITSYVEEGNPIGEKMARNAIEEKTRLKIENEKIFMTVYFNNSSYGFMSNIEVSYEEENLDVEENEESKSITFEVKSPDIKVKISLLISLMGRKVELFLVNDMNTATLIEDISTVNNDRESNIKNRWKFAQEYE